MNVHFQKSAVHRQGHRIAPADVAIATSRAQRDQPMRWTRCAPPDPGHQPPGAGGADRIHPRRLHQQGLRRDIFYLQWQTWLMGWILPAALIVATGCGAAACRFSSQGATLPHTCPVILLPTRLNTGRDLAPFGDKNQSARKRAPHEPKTPGAVSYLNPQAGQVQR